MVTVFGLGFVGLTTALGFAELGQTVFGVDPQKEKTDLIREGRLPFHEPGLDEALARHLGTRFFVTDDVAAAVAQSDYIYYCVGTPYGKDGAADLTYLYQAVGQTLDQIGDDRFRVLVTKSTIPPSTTQERVIPFVEKRGFAVGKALGVANNPEFLREGYCWEDFIHADRIVLGVSDDRSARMLRDLYAPMDAPVFTVSLNTGEFIKYLSNTLLATLISYSNEMAQAAYAFGDISIAEAFRILHMDKRWGGCKMADYVYPGCGYGGYCLPKDTNAFYTQSVEKGFTPAILHSVIKMNDAMPENIVGRIESACQQDKEKVIGVLGLSFKPGSDDVRDTPAAKIIGRLLERGYHKIIAYDPLAEKEYRRHYPHAIAYKESGESVAAESDLLVLTTAWPEFKDLVRDTPKEKIIDCRYML